MLSWVDDILIIGEPRDVKQVKSDLMSIFACTDEGPLVEYVGSKIDITRKPDGLASIKFTQPVLVQKLRDASGNRVEGCRRHLQSQGKS
jgi:hypothetical protein